MEAAIVEKYNEELIKAIENEQKKMSVKQKASDNGQYDFTHDSQGKTVFVKRIKGDALPILY